MSDAIEALENAAQVFSNLCSTFPNSVNDWEFHLEYTLKGLKSLKDLK